MEEKVNDAGKKAGVQEGGKKDMKRSDEERSNKLIGALINKLRKGFH